MILSSSQRLSQANKVYQEKISLINILTCLICTNKANQAHICPNCSKFYCQFCIKDWLIKKEKACPNCRKEIQINSLVNCNKLSQDLSGALEALIQFQFPNQLPCQIHSLGLSYYCYNCECPLCSDCIVLSQQHQGHKFVKINKIKVSFNQNILRLLSKIRNRKKQLEKEREQILGIQITDIGKQKIEIMNGHMWKMKDIYQSKTSHHLQKCRDQFLNQQICLNMNNKQYEVLLHSIKEQSKVNLMKKNQSQLETSFQKLNSRLCTSKIQVKNLKSARKYVKSSVFPQICEKNFVFNDFLEHYQNKESVIFSEVFSDGLNQWRLKIYPNGMSQHNRKDSGHISPRSFAQKNRNEYVSIYIELKCGVSPSNQFKHKIQIVHPSEPHKNISRTYQFEFSVGSCWGYYHFVKFATLQQEGFIDPALNSLKIKVHLGYNSYFHACIDKEKAIELKNSRVEENKRKIDILKKRLNIPCQFINQSKIQAIVERNEETFVKQTEQSINFQDFEVEIVKVQNKCGEQHDHQSKELSKIFRRIWKFQSKSLLIF